MRKPEVVATQLVRSREDPQEFAVQYISDAIGRGVFATKDIQHGSFIAEYHGTLLSSGKLENVKDTNYTYHFSHKGKAYCIDATEEPACGPRLGRLVNHGDSPKERNAVTKILVVDETPRLCLFSTRIISKGEQILYNYGVRNLPWQVKKKNDSQPATTATPAGAVSKHSEKKQEVYNPDVKKRDVCNQQTEKHHGAGTENHSNIVPDKAMNIKIGTENHLDIVSDEATNGRTDEENHIEIDTENHLDIVTDEATDDQTDEQQVHEVGTENHLDIVTDEATNDQTDKQQVHEVCTENHLDIVTDEAANDQTDKQQVHKVGTENLLDIVTDVAANDQKDKQQVHDGGTENHLDNVTDEATYDQTDKQQVHDGGTENNLDIVTDKATNDQTDRQLDHEVGTENHLDIVTDEATYDQTDKQQVRDGGTENHLDIVTDKATNDQTDRQLDHEVGTENHLDIVTDEATYDQTDKQQVHDGGTENHLDIVTDEATYDQTDKQQVHEVGTENHLDIVTDEATYDHTDKQQVHDGGTENHLDIVTDEATIDQTDRQQDYEVGTENHLNIVFVTDEVTDDQTDVEPDVYVVTQEHSDVVCDLGDCRLKVNNDLYDEFELSPEEFDIQDDSFNDPDFEDNDSTSCYSYSAEDEDDQLFNSKKRKSRKDNANHKRQRIGFKRNIVACTPSADCVPGSDDSCESTMIPDLSKFLTKEPCTLSDDNHAICTSQSLPAFGLLPKQQTKSGCKQIYDKINYCAFCKKAIKSKISRHLLSVHKSETRVCDILILPKRSEERMIRFEILANEGNFKHNVNVLKNKDGYLVVGRRESKERDFKVGSYLPCDFCKKFILKETLWFHHNNCSVMKFLSKSSGASNTNERRANAVRLSRQLLNSALMETTDATSGSLSKLIDRMNHDEVTEEFVRDDLLRRYAVLKVESLGRAQDQKINDIYRVSQSCRTLARLVIRCRTQSELIIDMNRLISPRNFDLIVNATKAMCFDNNKEAPSLGKLIGNNLAHILQVKKGVALRNDDERSLQDAENFQKVFEAEWNYRINAVCQKVTNTVNRQKVKTIPLTEDLQKLRSYILSSMEKSSIDLQTMRCSEAWTRLAKHTLCRLILFNKRRRAEVKDLKIDEYTARPNWQEEQQGEFRLALTTTDRMLAERMDMVISAGKSRKNVDAYVIMPPDAKKAVTLLNTTRNEVGVPRSNPYIFARMNSDSPLTGNTDLREIVNECHGIQHPERITSTGLRRYIATVSQILDMSETELESLARHLGHDVQTHRQNYRLSHATRELTVVSQLLIAVDNGHVNKWKGKHLADISVDELPDVPVDEEETEEVSNENSGSPLAGPSLAGRSLAGPSLAGTSLADSSLAGPSLAGPSLAGPSLAGPDVEDVAMESDAELEAINQNYGGKRQGKRSSKRPWSRGTESYLRNFFKHYLKGVRSSLHQDDMLQAQSLCPDLRQRTLAQIRSKLNNMKLGKSK